MVPLAVVTFQQKASSETYGHGASPTENKWSMVPENNVKLGGGGISLPFRASSEG